MPSGPVALLGSRARRVLELPRLLGKYQRERVLELET
jgi:hypothetical protein